MFTRFNGNVVPFADDATSTNRTVFGGTTQSDLIDDNLNTNFKKGWEIVGLNDNPTREDFNAMGYTLGALTAYLYEMGISEWNASQNYRLNSRVIGSNGNLYKALTGTIGSPNVGKNPTSDAVNWQLEIITDYSTLTAKTTPVDADLIPLSDSALSFGIKKLSWANIKATLKTYFDISYVALTGNQTIAGIKTFSSPIKGNFIGSILFSGSTGNAYDHSNIMVNGNGGANTIKPSIGFHQSGLYAGTLSMLDENTFQFQRQDGQLATVAKSPNDSGVKTALNASGAAPIYACRAWVNFNGTGAVAIRASGNVSSITDNGTGDYTVNFTTAMPDANYSINGIVGDGINTSTSCNIQMHTSSPYSTSYARFYMNVVNSGAYGLSDMLYTNVSIFR